MTRPTARGRRRGARGGCRGGRRRGTSGGRSTRRCWRRGRGPDPRQRSRRHSQPCFDRLSWRLTSDGLRDRPAARVSASRRRSSSQERPARRASPALSAGSCFWHWSTRTELTTTWSKSHSSSSVAGLVSLAPGVFSGADGLGLVVGQDDPRAGQPVLEGVPPGLLLAPHQCAGHNFFPHSYDWPQSAFRWP